MHGYLLLILQYTPMSSLLQSDFDVLRRVEVSAEDLTQLCLCTMLSFRPCAMTAGTAITIWCAHSVHVGAELLEGQL